MSNISYFGVVHVQKIQEGVVTEGLENGNGMMPKTYQIPGHLDGLLDDRFAYEMRLDTINSEIQETLKPIVLSVFKYYKNKTEYGLSLTEVSGVIQQQVSTRFRSEDMGMAIRALAEERKLGYIGSTNKFEYLND